MWVLVVIVTLFDRRRECIVVEDIGRRCGRETRRGYGGSGRSSGERERSRSKRRYGSGRSKKSDGSWRSNRSYGGSWFERNGVDVVEVEAIKVVGKE